MHLLGHFKNAIVQQTSRVSFVRWTRFWFEVFIEGRGYMKCHVQLNLVCNRKGTSTHFGSQNVVSLSFIDKPMRFDVLQYLQSSVLFFKGGVSSIHFLGTTFTLKSGVMPELMLWAFLAQLTNESSIGSLESISDLCDADLIYINGSHECLLKKNATR